MSELRTLRGYAALYNVETEIGGMFREQIAPGALDEAIRKDDVRALLNHDASLILGRTAAGTLRLSSDARGLLYEVDLDPADDLAARVWRLVKRGDISQSSFSFAVRGEEWAPPVTRTGLPLRTITAASLYDVSPVTFPAYAATTVVARSLDVTAAEAALKARLARWDARPVTPSPTKTR